MEGRDWFIVLQVVVAWVAATVWIFIHPAVESFVAWCGLATTMTSAYHWLNIHDAKTEDASK